MIEEMQPSVSLPREMRMLSNKEFCMRNSILNEAACAACDDSKKNNYFSGLCVIADVGRSKSIRWKCTLNDQNLNNTKTFEGHLFLMLLELMHRINYRLRRGKVVLRMDRRCLIKDATTPPLKPSQRAKDYEAIRARPDKIKKALDTKIEIRYS